MSKTKIRVGSHTYDMADEKLRDHVGYVGPSDTAGVPSLAYELSADGTYYIVTGRGTVRGNEIVIPDTYEGKPVEEIGAKAFYGDEQITKITVGANVSYIGGGAFICPNLAELYFTRQPTTEELEKHGQTIEDNYFGYFDCCETHGSYSGAGTFSVYAGENFWSTSYAELYLRKAAEESMCEDGSHIYNEDLALECANNA